MSAIYELGLAAQELINEFGGAGTYMKVTASSYDPSQAQAVTTPTYIPVQIVLFDLLLKNEGLGTKPGTAIKAGDKEAYMIPPSFTSNSTPLVVDPVNDKIIVNSVTYSIVTFKEINPTGTYPVAYTFYLRR